MKYHDRFEWDTRKAAANLKKNRVSFDEAAEVLADIHADVYHIEEYDDEYSTDEDRFITTGSHPKDRQLILTIAWTERSKGGKRVTRIISARIATSRERKRYGEEINQRLLHDPNG